MKNMIPTLLAGAMMIIAGAAIADCPLSMPQETLVECLTVEGSGENYQDYQRKFAEELADMAEETLNATNNSNESDGRITANVHR
ncbi:MAG TPA: hypothetical protein ENJ17_02750 [Gammaproteobacteria bacterium]|nr:hypothetical protein [Gammaproteobacteria bacterium]